MGRPIEKKYRKTTAIKHQSRKNYGVTIVTVYYFNFSTNQLIIIVLYLSAAIGYRLKAFMLHDTDKIQNIKILRYIVSIIVVPAVFKFFTALTWNR